MEESKKYILTITSDLLTQKLLKVILKNHGCRAIGIRTAQKALDLIHKKQPELIIIDTKPKEMTFDKFSKILREDSQTEKIPLFSLGEIEHEPGGDGKFSSGTVNWLINSINREYLIKMVETYVRKKQNMLLGFEGQLDLKLRSPLLAFQKFKVFMKMHFQLPDSFDSKIDKLASSEIYSFGEEIGILESKMAVLIADFMKVPAREHFSPEEIMHGYISEEFCKKKWIIPLKGKQSPVGFVLSNPFDSDLIEDLQKIIEPGAMLELGVMNPSYLNIFLGNYEEDLEVVSPEGENGLQSPLWKKMKTGHNGDHYAS